MPDDSKTSAPIEIIIRVDPTAAAQAVKRGASSAWRSASRIARSKDAVICYWVIAATVVVGIISALASAGILTPKAIGSALAVATLAGLVALKQRYFPLIRD